MIDRVKFAIARGAKAEYFNQSGNLWVDYCPINPGRVPFRIAAGDKHLEYGPISSVLIEAATDEYRQGYLDWSHEKYVFLQAGTTVCTMLCATYENPYDPFFMLFAAEYLADLGL